jgi:GDP-L-fucose synthase
MLSREKCETSFYLFYCVFHPPYLINQNYVTSSPFSENGTPFVVAGTGKPLRQFVYSYDLAKMFIWQLREYDDVEPIIFSVGEDEDVSIRYVAEQIVKAYGFTGEVKVRVWSPRP